MIIENGVTLNKIFFRTDGELNLYRRFENIFSQFRPLSYQFCKRHFTENLRVNLQQKGKIGWICSGGYQFNESLYNSYEKLKILTMLPSHLIVDMLEFLITESFGTFHAPEFIEYLRNKVTPDFAKRISYFLIIKNAT